MLATITGLLGVFVGALIGNWLALGRDRRKEFNEYSDPIRSKLRNHITTNGTSMFVSGKELEIFSDHISRFKKKSYLNSVKNYLAVYDRCYKINNSGNSVLVDKKLFFSVVNDLLRYVNRK